MFEKAIEEQLNRIKKDENTSAILLAGAAATLEPLKEAGLNDIDLWVIKDNGSIFEREVFEHNGIQYDISYIPKAMLKKGISDKWPFLLSAFKKYRLLYVESDETKRLLSDCQSAYEKGLDTLSLREIRYIRFQLGQVWNDIKNRQNERYTVEILLCSTLMEALKAYFKLNGLWVPKEKAVLRDIEKIDKTLYNKVAYFFDNSSQDKKIAAIYDIIDYVLGPFGGILTEWVKSEFPLK